MAENGPCVTMGDEDGENEKLGWNGPADVMMGSLSGCDVSRNGMMGLAMLDTCAGSLIEYS